MLARSCCVMLPLAAQRMRQGGESVGGDAESSSLQHMVGRCTS